MDNKYKQLIDISLDTKDFKWAKKLTEIAIGDEKFKDITKIKMMDKTEISKVFENKSEKEKIDITSGYIHNKGKELGKAISDYADYMLAHLEDIEEDK